MPRTRRLLSSTPRSSVPPAVLANATTVRITPSGEERSRLNSSVLPSGSFRISARSILGMFLGSSGPGQASEFDRGTPLPLVHRVCRSAASHSAGRWSGWLDSTLDPESLILRRDRKADASKFAGHQVQVDGPRRQPHYEDGIPWLRGRVFIVVQIDRPQDAEQGTSRLPCAVEDGHPLFDRELLRFPVPDSSGNSFIVVRPDNPDMNLSGEGPKISTEAPVKNDRDLVLVAHL